MSDRDSSDPGHDGAGHGEPGPVLLFVPEGLDEGGDRLSAPSGRPGRRRRWLLYAAGALILTAGAAVMLSSKAPLGAPSASGRSGAAGANPNVTLLTLADSIQAALGAWNSATTPGSSDSVGCPRLSGRYRVVDDAFVALAVRLQAVDDAAIAPHVRQRLQGLVQRVEEVNEEFDASGCPRPD